MAGSYRKILQQANGLRYIDVMKFFRAIWRFFSEIAEEAEREYYHGHWATRLQNKAADRAERRSNSRSYNSRRSGIDRTNDDTNFW